MKNEYRVKEGFEVGDAVLVRGRGTGFVTTAPSPNNFATVELDDGTTYGAYLRELVQLEAERPIPTFPAGNFTIIWRSIFEVF